MVRCWKLPRKLPLAGFLALASCAAVVLAQSAGTPPPMEPVPQGSAQGTASSWRSPTGAAGAATSGTSLASSTPAAPRTPLTKFSSGAGTLPNDGGQVWREYDITPYTLRVTSTSKPEQAMVDWILRETGYDAWHSDPLSILSANGRTLRVYATPQMQDSVSEIVDRFMNTQAETQSFGMRIVTIGSPSWRGTMQRVLHPVPVQSQGVEAWLLSKEDAVLMFSELQKRTDFREHSSPQLLVQNGQSTVITATRPRNYIRGVILRAEAFPGFQPDAAQVDEGYSLEFKPLLSLDGRSIDAVIKCNIDQVEKLMPVTVDVPTPVAPRQKTSIQVPQLSSIRFAEKFHWPTDMVLVIGMGVVPTPTPTEPTAVKIPLISQSDHADLLVFVENRGLGGKPPSVGRAIAPPTTGQRY